MTQEEKQLLLKDLCVRLPYGVKISKVVEDYISEPKTLKSINVDGCIVIENEPFDDGTPDIDCWHISEVKPYLRPLSSMTENEFQNLKRYSGLIYYQLELQEFYDNSKCLEFYLSEIPSYVVILVFDWLNKYHFDYRGLIPMGLALEVPERMYNT